eukprot:3398144-Amphidinium_carterae.1
MGLPRVATDGFPGQAGTLGGEVCADRPRAGCSRTPRARAQVAEPPLLPGQAGRRGAPCMGP